MALKEWPDVESMEQHETKRVSAIQENVRRRRRNLKRKHQRLQKQANLMRLMRSPTPVPDVASSAEEKALRVGDMLTDKDCSIVVDLSNYKPFTAANDAPYMFGSPDTAHDRHPPLMNCPEVQLRFLNPGDLFEVKQLCKEWFPIEYPDSWYTDITSNVKFYAVACIIRGQIVGLVVAEIKDALNLPKEDSQILAPTFRSGTKIGYILSLGVVKEYRQNGIASFMLENLIAHLTSQDHQCVKAIYLHVLTTNSRAISFYEHRGFRPHQFLPYYYAIKGKRKDGFTYVLYINGGHPPWSLLDYMTHCCGIMCSTFNPWSLARFAYRKLNLALLLAMPRLRQISHSSTAVFS